MTEFIGRAGWGYLIVVGVAVPWAAARSARAFERRPLPPRLPFLFSIILQQAALAWLALWVARREYILLAWRVERPLAATLAGVVLTGAMIMAARPLWYDAVRRRDRRAYLTMPRTPGERVLWIGVSLAAGVGEEVAYRAVLFALLLRILGSPVQAALAAAALFGLAHLVQGWKSTLIVAGVALVLQALVWITGGLAAAIVVHVAFDVVAGLAYGWYGERLGYPIEGVPPSGGRAHA
ncbi:MAG: CPBP family intramembrane glutamic endopeptidase [Gemmatimonadota bacterium]